mgnify:CR=1 FL=1
MEWSKAVRNAVTRLAQRQNGYFTRQDLIAKELSSIIESTRSKGKSPEQTLSRELQELAATGFISFLDNRGSYRLTDIEAGKGNFARIAARYFIDGFRSFHNFDIVLEPGLNVLVGPNGSGKTNFIDFLDFLSVLILRNASTAVSTSGGITRVFSQENNKKSQRKLQSTISGTADIFRGSLTEEKLRYFRFEHTAHVDFSKKNSAIYISFERIRFFSLHSTDDLSQTQQRLVGAIEIRRASPQDDCEPVIKVSKGLHKTSKRNPLRYLRVSPSGRIAPRLVPENAEPFQLYSLGADESMLSLRGFRPALDHQRNSLSRKIVQPQSRGSKRA